MVNKGIQVSTADSVTHENRQFLKLRPQQFVPKWRCPKMRVLLYHPFIDRIFCYKPSGYWGNPIYGSPKLVDLFCKVNSWGMCLGVPVFRHHRFCPCNSALSFNKLNKPSSRIWCGIDWHFKRRFNSANSVKFLFGDYTFETCTIQPSIFLLVPS